MHSGQMFCCQNASNSISAGALPQTPLEELTALPQTSELDLRGSTSKRKGGKERREKKEEGRGGRGKTRKGGDREGEREEGRGKGREDRE